MSRDDAKCLRIIADWFDSYDARRNVRDMTEIQDFLRDLANRIDDNDFENISKMQETSC